MHWTQCGGTSVQLSSSASPKIATQEIGSAGDVFVASCIRRNFTDSVADSFTGRAWTNVVDRLAIEELGKPIATFDLQLDPSSPGLSFHRLDGARTDKGFFSVRASRDIRLIVHKTSANFLLCYVDHHDAAIPLG